MPTFSPSNSSRTVLLLVVAGLWLTVAGTASASWFWPFKKSKARRAAEVAPPPPVDGPPAWYAYEGWRPSPPDGWQQQPAAQFPPPQPGSFQTYTSLQGMPGAAPVTTVRRAMAVPEFKPPPRVAPVVYQPPPPPAQSRPVFIPPSPQTAPPTTLTAAMMREVGKLSRKGLGYRFGSMDPSTGGLDCSGAVKCVLDRAGARGVPRTATDQYVWLQKAGTLTPLRRGANPDWVLSRLRPGDLLFWRGTYVTKRWPDVSHVMIYLGRDRNGRPMMFGARSSESSRGLHGHAVDIYQFNPVPRGKSEFIGFGRVPQ